MEPNRNQHLGNTGDVPLGYGETDFAGVYCNSGIQDEGVAPNPVNPLFPPTVENCDFPLGGYGNTWSNYFSNFSLPIDPVDTSEQLTPEQLAQLDEYLNSLSQGDSLSSGSDTAIYSSHRSTEVSGNVFSDGNTDFNHAAEAGRQLYSDAYNQWNFASPPAENAQLSEGMYNHFGAPNNVFQSGLNQDIQTKSNDSIHSRSPISETLVSTKPSFADVAKNKPTAVNQEPVPKIKDPVPRNYNTKPGKVGSSKKDTPSAKPTGSNHGITNIAKNNPRQSKSCRPANMQRSKSVPVEPSDIRPDSRYGLDTFDYSNTFLQDQRVAASCNSSRKNSTSSVSSGLSGLEDVHWSSPRNLSDPSKSCDSQCSSLPKQPAPQNFVQSGKEGKNSPNKEGLQEQRKHHSQHGAENVYFDPQRIFQDSHEKSSKSDKTNNEDYVPNNKQKLQPEKEYILHKEKPKASVKCDSKFINNDLRDNKKHTNLEQERDHYQGPKDSRPKSTNHSGSQTRTRAKTAKFEHNVSSKNPNKPSKTSVQQYIIGDFLIIVWIWFIWGCRELMHFSWSLLKLLLSVTILLLAVLAHYTIVFCVKIWSWVRERIPYLRRNHDFDWPDGVPNSKLKQYGLKENITLPTTGSEAMKRLLSCRGKDPYCILGVRGDASDEDIKKYYRKQAVLVHPDKNQQPGAEEAFKILGHAFDLIGSVENRQEYDGQIQKKDAEAAMHEFTDLLTKLHEKLQEASNLLRCDHCGEKHKRVPTERPVYAARFCDRCNTRHPAKEGDVWAESKMLGFLWHYFACMEGKVYDITEWASCKRDNFKSMNANSHQVIYRLSTGGGRGKGKAGEPTLEDFLSTLFQSTTMTGEGGTSSGDFPSGSGKGNPGNQSQSTKSKQGKKKKKKH